MTLRWDRPTLNLEPLGTSLSDRVYQFFPYYGSKLRAAKKYPEPLYDSVIEPFAGGAGYSTHHWQRQVLLVDSNPDIVDTWKFLVGATADDIAAIPLLEPEQPLDELNLERGPALLVGWWCVRASATPRKKLSSWCGKWPDRFWGAKIRDRIAAQVDKISHWAVKQADYIWAQSGPATYFVDPPYQSGGHVYPRHTIDYEALATWCRQLEGQVLVCEQTPATWLPFVEFYKHKGIQKEERTELIYQRLGRVDEDEDEDEDRR